jgi:hypothetical protein
MIPCAIIPQTKFEKMNTILIVISLIMSIILYHYYYYSVSIPQQIIKNGKFTDEDNEIIYKYNNNNKISSTIQVIGSWYFLGLTFFQIYKRTVV